jgi:hypothetical protein
MPSSNKGVWYVAGFQWLWTSVTTDNVGLPDHNCGPDCECWGIQRALKGAGCPGNKEGPQAKCPRYNKAS